MLPTFDEKAGEINAGDFEVKIGSMRSV